MKQRGKKKYPLPDGLHCITADTLAKRVGISVHAARCRLERWPADRWYETPNPDKQCTSKLLPKEVAQIREFSALGMTGTEIAKEFNVTPSAISRVLKGKTSWSSLDN